MNFNLNNALAFKENSQFPEAIKSINSAINEDPLNSSLYLVRAEIKKLINDKTDLDDQEKNLLLRITNEDERLKIKEIILRDKKEIWIRFLQTNDDNDLNNIINEFYLQYGISPFKYNLNVKIFSNKISKQDLSRIEQFFASDCLLMILENPFLLVAIDKFPDWCICSFPEVCDWFALDPDSFEIKLKISKKYQEDEIINNEGKFNSYIIKLIIDSFLIKNPLRNLDASFSF